MSVYRQTVPARDFMGGETGWTPEDEQPIGGLALTQEGEALAERTHPILLHRPLREWTVDELRRALTFTAGKYAEDIAAELDRRGWGEQREPLTLRELTLNVAAINREKGWHDDGRTIGDDCALLHSEISEMLEEHRSGHAPADVYFPAIEADVEVDATNYDPLLHGKPEGFGIEAADLLIRLVDVAYRRGMDLEALVELKLKYNATRPYRHGGRAL